MANTFFRLLGKLFWVLRKIVERIIMYILSSQFKSFGKNALFHPFTTVIKGYENIVIGDYSTIGPNCTVYSIDSQLKIGRKTGIGPGSIIITGNHSTHIIGKFYKDYILKDKLGRDDADLIIEDDVWIGAGCIILKGASIGRGSIIGAGSLINKPIPPYSIAFGSPSKVVSRRFKAQEIIAHEKMLYTPESRLHLDFLLELEK